MSKPLININESLRKSINDRLYSKQLLIEHLGTPNPSALQLHDWKQSWPVRYEVEIDSLHKAKQVIKEQEIPELLYKFEYGDTGKFHADAYSRIHEKSVIFYSEEDMVLFKLMYHSI